MLIALLVVLGVDLVIVIAVALLVIGRRRWLKKQPGEFAGEIRVSCGQIDGLGPAWKRGSGRWVRDVLVWSRAPFLFRNVLVPVDRPVGERRAGPREFKRLGDSPLVAEFLIDGAAIEIAANADDRDRLLGAAEKPWETPRAATVPESPHAAEPAPFTKPSTPEGNAPEGNGTPLSETG